MNALLRLARPHQWVKNLLLLVPLIAAQRVRDADAWLALLPAFVALCLASSAAYALNDVVDVAADRGHPSKRRRPLASGEVSAGAALAFAALLAGGALVLGLALSRPFATLLAAYLAGTIVYSLVLKRFAYADMGVLTALYVLRIELGAIAIAVQASRWLVAFSIAAFASLAALKRAVELDGAQRDGQARLAGRGYRTAQAGAVRRLGIGSAAAAVAILAAYALSLEAAGYYRQPSVLWVIVVLTAFWFARAWRLARRGAIDGDPVAFALRDGASYAVLAATGVALYAAA